MWRSLIIFLTFNIAAVLSVEVCPPNEELVPCPEAVCRPTKCSEVGFPVDCPDLKSCPSKPAYICSEGYVRNDTGTCIPVRECPSCGGDENAWSGCGVKCKTCAETIKICPRICIPNSCDCKPGYLYDKNLNKCVPSDKCTPTCGPNEVYSNCTNRACHKSTCAQLAIPTVCRFYTNGSHSPDPSCKGGCECASGYLRDSNNTCIPEDQCPKAQCGINEEYVENPVCRPTTCSDLGYPLPCSELNSETTSNQGPGCICKAGYVRNGNGTCISDRECPSCGGDINARSGCGTFCTTCDNYGESVACILLCRLNGCDCKEGYVYNNITKKCVLPENCPPKKCNKRNEIEGCKNACPPRTCEAKKRVYKCPPQAAVCISECVCKPDFFRNSAGDCIIKEQCCTVGVITPNIICGPDEEYDGCVNGGCGRFNCSIPGIICTDLVEGACKPGCRCKEPLLRTDDGRCVPSEQCPQPLKNNCGPDEEFNDCVNGGCGRFNCSQTVAVCIHLVEGACVPGCRCKEPLLRNDDGKCVPDEECPPPKNPTGGNGSCYQPNDNNNNNNDNNENNDTDNKIKEFIAGNGVFTTKFLSESAKNNPGKSLIGSPFSIVVLLAQLALFAVGQASEQLFALLNLKTAQQIRESVPLMLTSLDGEQNITLTIAEKVFGSIDFPLSKKFLEVSRSLFKAEGQNLDYSKPQEAAKIINDWVSSKTNNLIQNLVPADALGPSIRLVLANAIYFKGNWSKPFKKENTQPKDFHVSDSKTVTVQMMNQVGTFKYGVMPESKAQVIELPYENENITFLVLLPPNTADGMKNLLTEQLNFTSITAVRSNLRETKVNLSLPKFETETSTDLKDILEKANVTEIFNPQGSGLKGMLETPEDVFVSYILQKAKILVFEEGAEAAAGNAIVVGVTSVRITEEPVEYNADRSFIYYLWHKDNPVFCGLYNGPE